jgi:hypothetical protein
MSSIHFSADLDSSKLEASIKQSNKTVKDWAKDVEKAGGQADQGLTKMTKSFKDAIKDQKQLIKDIEGDVKKLQKAYDDATAGRGKMAAAGELRSAKKALAEEQATLLGLQKQQIESNNKEEDAISRLVGGIGKWAAGLFTVGAALKIAKGIIDSTEATTHKFEQAVAGASSGLQYFYKSIATGDWTDFFGNMGKAIKGAVEFVDAMETLSNRQNEQKIKSAELDKEIADLRADTYDKDEANNEARRDSLTKIISKQEEKYRDEAKLAKELYDINLKRAATDSGLSETQIENFIKEYSSFEKLLEVGEKYNELQKLMYAPGTTNKFLNELEGQIKLLGPGAKEAGKYAKEISKVTQEVRKQLSDFAASEIKASAAFGEKNRRDKAQLAQVENKIKDDKEAAKKKAVEDAKIENKIKVQQDSLDKAIEEGNQKEIKAIGSRIAKLQEELEVRRRITELAIGAAITREAPLGKVKVNTPTLLPGGLKIPNTLANAPAFSTGDFIPGTTMLSDRGKENQKRREKEIPDAGNDGDEKKKKNQQELIAGASELVYLAGEQLGLSDQELSVLDSKLQVIGQFASGNYLGAAISTVISVVSGFMELMPNQSEKLNVQIEHINQLLKEQQRLIDISETKGGQSSARKGEIDLLKEQLTVQEAALKKAQDYLDPDKFKLFRTGSGIEKAKKTWEEMTLAIQETKNAIDDANSSLDDFFTGTSQGSIADAISQGLQNSETSASDYADMFYGFMRKAIDTALQDALSIDLTDWYQQFAADMASGGGLSDEETAALKKWYDDIISKAKETRDAAYTVAGINTIGSSVNTGLTGQIQRSITEDTGSELAGLFRRFADEQRVIKDYSILGVTHLVGIEANTMNTVLELQKANIKLDTVISNTKQVPAGSL